MAQDALLELVRAVVIGLHDDLFDLLVGAEARPEDEFELAEH